MEKCAQSMWRLLVKIVPSLTGESYDGNMTAFAGELVAMDADVIFGCGFVEHIFYEYKEIFHDSLTTLESCDEFYDLPNKASTLAGVEDVNSQRDLSCRQGACHETKVSKFNEKDKEGFCVDGSLVFWGPRSKFQLSGLFHPTGFPSWVSDGGAHD